MHIWVNNWLFLLVFNIASIIIYNINKGGILHSSQDLLTILFSDSSEMDSVYCIVSYTI